MDLGTGIDKERTNFIRRSSIQVRVMKYRAVSIQGNYVAVRQLII